VLGLLDAQSGERILDLDCGHDLAHFGDRLLAR
jgi:hypothetical protein